MAGEEIERRERLGGCRLLREIGRGGMSVVYEAVEEGTDRRTAVKVLSAFRALDRRRVERFWEEAKTALKLRHESIVPVHRVGEEDGNYFIVMDFIEGTPLDDAWKEQLIDFKAAAGVVLQCAGALEYAHRAGLVHLDVKPQNILIDGRTRRAYLADFGLALAAGVRSSDGAAIAGTPRYMSPEQAAGNKDVDLRSDIFSLGVTLYNLITYTHPFGGEDVHILLQNVIACDFKRPRDINPRIPSALEAIVLKAMEKNPARRYQSAQEMARDLRSFLEGESVTASVPILKRKGFRLLGLRGTWYIAALLVLATLVGIYFLGPKDWPWKFLHRDGPEDGGRSVDLARSHTEAGDRFFDRGDYPAARSSYDRALDLAPDDKVTLVKRGQIHASLGDFHAALGDFDAALRIDGDFVPALKHRSEANMELGRFVEARGDIERALRIVRGKDGEERRASDLLASLGRLHFLTQNTEGALRVLDEAQRLDSGNARACLYSGLALLKKKEFDRAIEEVSRAKKIGIKDREIQSELERIDKELENIGLKSRVNRLQAAVHLREGMYAKAAGFATRALGINPSDTHALLLRGQARFHLSEYEKAESDFTRTLDLVPESAEAFGWRARTRRLLGHLKKAVEDGRRALALDGESSLFRRELGLCLAALGKTGEAVVHLMRAVESRKEDVEAVRVLMEIFSQTQNHTQALWAAARVLALDPDHRAARLVRSRAYFFEEDYEAAARELDRIEGTATAEIRLLRARILLRTGKPGEALGELGAVKSAVGSEGRELLRLRADAHRSLEREQEYLRDLSRLIALAPRDVDLRRERGSFLLRRGDWEEALDDFQRILTVRPCDPEIHLLRAQGALGLGRLGQALESADRSLRLSKKPGTLLIRGRILFKRREYKRALIDFDGGLALCRAGDLDLAYELGFERVRALSALGRQGEALRAAGDIARKHPGRDAMEKYRIDLLLEAGRAEDARKAYVARGRFPDDRDFRAYFETVWDLREGRTREASRRLQKLSRVEGIEPHRLPLLRAELLLAQNRGTEALPHLDRAVAQAPHRYRPWFLRAGVNETLGRGDEALKDYGRALAIQGQDPAVFVARALLLERRSGGERQALEDLKQAVRLGGGAPPHFYRARILRRLRNLEEAEKELAIALRLDPSNRTYLQAAAGLAEGAGKLEDALGHYAGLTDAEPEVSQWAYHRGKVLVRLRRFAEGRKWLEKALRGDLGPDLRGKARLCKAEALVGQGAFRKAIEVCSEVAQEESALAIRARILRGEAYLLKGRNEHGIGSPNEDFVRAYHDINAYYAAALEGKLGRQQSAAVRGAMGLYQWIAEKDPEQALTELTEAERLHPESPEPSRRIGAMGAGGLWPAGADRAVAALRRARRLGHTDRAGLAFDLGILLGRKGEYLAAAGEFRAALRARPGWTEARKELEAMERMSK
jgi:tetratricopeptide (TPR) repeat protein/predicted Ser/Thr protein kinase